MLVSPMRGTGTELFAGVTVDPAFGPVLAVGLGGVFIEVLHDVSLRALPVGADEVERMLGELRGAAVLGGARGRAAVDVRRRLSTVDGAVMDFRDTARADGGMRQMTKRQIVSADLARPSGVFSHATTIAAKGTLVFGSGMVAKRADGSTAGIGDIT